MLAGLPTTLHAAHCQYTTLACIDHKLAQHRTVLVVLFSPPGGLLNPLGVLTAVSHVVTYSLLTIAIAHSYWLGLGF
jgi:hypothetical protein